MMFNNKSKENIVSISPKNHGWYEVKLNQQELDYVWKCVNDNKKGKEDNAKGGLAGNIDSSWWLKDRGNWFFKNTLEPLAEKYREEFADLERFLPTNQPHPLEMIRWWVNYQKQGEFQPSHQHFGLWSFVIWLKIPYDHTQQNKKLIASDAGGGCQRIGTFEFSYVTSLGQSQNYEYKLNPSFEGTMLFFPAGLVHTVYPFYDCDEDRISVSGNISYNTTIRL